MHTETVNPKWNRDQWFVEIIVLYVNALNKVLTLKFVWEYQFIRRFIFFKLK